MHIIAGVAFALVFVVGAFGSRWLDAPDYRALCEAECSCTGCVVSQCMDKYDELGEAQEECRAAGDRIASCKLQQGGARCETGGGWTPYMPTELADLTRRGIASEDMFRIEKMGNRAAGPDSDQTPSDSIEG